MERTVSLVVDVGGNQVHAGRFRLVDTQSGAEFPRDGEAKTTIGSAPGNDIQIDDRSVSRFHCSIEVTPKGARIVDCGSSNGTLVNEVPVESAWLVEGATLRLGAVQLRFHVEEGTRPVRLGDDRFGGLVGASRVMRSLFADLERAAASDATLLLSGPTGTGKTAAARAVHDASRRAGEPFEVVDLASVSAELIESELFGHEKGAFTGAIQSFAGAFERAKRGTVFLDEIGELPLALQPKLLRILESRTVRRVGGSRELRLDVRIIAASHRNLRADVNEGRFREDLVYRLAVIEAELPALRDRAEDLPALCEALMESMNPDDVDREALSPEVMHRFMRMPWPGNVRELRNRLERLFVLGDLMTPGEQPDTAYESARAAAIVSFERSYVEQLMAAYDGNVTQAAKAAGIARGYLHRLIRRSRKDVAPAD